MRRLFLLILLFSNLLTQAQGPHTLAALGAHYYRTKEYDSCIPCYAQVNKLKPNDPCNLIGKGVCEIRVNKYVEGLADFNRALELDKDNAIANYDIACIYSLEKDAKKANYYLDKALASYKKQIAGFMETDEDLRFLRTDPGYLDLKKKYGIS
jgi:tetratricopeptide (TPR) repeat protein